MEIPFGIKKALLHLHRVINLILGDLVDVYILVYLDDVFIYLSMAEDHTKHVKTIFKWLVKSKLYLKHKKNALFYQK